VMTQDAKHVLLVAPFFVDYASKEALRATTGLTEYHLDNAVEELVELKLLDIKETSVALGQRYSVHPLTRAFANAQLGKRQEFEEQARTRWSKYYIDFVAHSLGPEKLKDPYWDSLPAYGHKFIDPEWLNLREVLTWADQQGQDHILVELMLVLTHYMCTRMLFSTRLYYAQKAAEAANKLGRKEDAAILHIDALGWILFEQGRLVDAIREITTGLCIAQSLDASSIDATDLISLANTFLAMTFLDQGDLAKASELMDKVASFEYKPIVHYRVSMVAGDILYKRNNITEAIKIYKSVYQISMQYGGEDVHSHLGNAYLASGDLIQAEACFNEVLAIEQHFGTSAAPYAKYGLARVALAKGERDKARQIAQELLDDLSRTVTSHRLLNEIHRFLESLESIS